MRTISTSSYCPISARSGGTTSSSTASTSSTAVSCEAKGLAYKFARFWALPCQGFASPLRALDCSGPIRGATLFTRGKRGFGPWGARAGRRTTGAEIARALKTMDY